MKIWWGKKFPVISEKMICTGERMEKLISDVKELLSEKRFRHSMGVMKLSVSLARQWGADEKKAAEAAILHDAAKEFDDEKMKYYFDMADVSDEIIINTKELWHGIAGAYYAKEKYGTDDEVFNAIYYHTVGMRNMPMLTKIIYLADTIEETRDGKLPWAKEMREKAHEDIDAALLETVNRSIEYILGKGGKIHPEIMAIRNELVKSRY